MPDRVDKDRPYDYVNMFYNTSTDRSFAAQKSDARSRSYIVKCIMKPADNFEAG